MRVPDFLVRHCAHLVGKAVLVSTVFLCCYRGRASALPDVLGQNASFWVCELQKNGWVLTCQRWKVGPSYPEVDVKVTTFSDLVRDSHLGKVN